MINIDKEKLLELAEEYEFSFSKLMNYYTKLKGIPCVINGGEDKFLECLEVLISDRTSNSFIVSQQHNKEDAMEKQKLIEESISYALYLIYEDEAIPYLSDGFKKARGLSENPFSSGL